MLGGLHIEMALWSVCGDMLDSSGWTTALTDAGIASSGTSNSFLKVSHLTKTRRTHQITAAALYILLHDAYKKANGDEYVEEEFQKWHSEMMNSSPTYKFWYTIMQLELTILTFIKAHRVNDFTLYVETLEVLVPWFFALDHTNYARWLPIHIRDMRSLPESIQGHMKTCWIISKSLNKFSSIPIDQAHEQNNAIVKGIGGAIGLTENPVAFRRWMVAGPEMARLLQEFEDHFMDCNHGGEQHNEHHEQGPATQKNFQRNVKNLVTTISEMGNPFSDECSELVVLDTRNCADDSVVDTINTIEELGLRQYKKYVKDVIIERTASIDNSIPRNSVALFKRQKPKQITKTSQKLLALTSDRFLFSRLYIASQQRDGDLEEFFMHENQPYPPSLSEFGSLRFGKKSDLLACINKVSSAPHPQSCDVKVFDGAALVHALPTSSVSTFDEYANIIFIPFLHSHLLTTTRIDVVWDEYRQASLKEAAREKRGKGVRRKVAGHVKIPRQWQWFLEDSSNKEELFHFLTEAITNTSWPDDKNVVVTSGILSVKYFLFRFMWLISVSCCFIVASSSNYLYKGFSLGENVISSSLSHQMQRCNHEEADTRMLVHVKDAIGNGSRSVWVRTVDTDVIVILAAEFHNMSSLHPGLTVWVAFGMGKHFQYISINSICDSLGEDKSQALLFFHALTGSDTTSAFQGKGKKSAWEAWTAYPGATEAFVYVRDSAFIPLEISSPVFKVLERFVIVMYDRASSTNDVNSARRELFTKKGRALENIPPTQV